MIIGVDFDGTCVEHMYPAVGPDVPGAMDTLRKAVARGDQLILWTMRSGQSLLEAQKWFQQRGIPLFGSNRNPEQSSWTSSPKAYCQVYVDDAALGCPLKHPKGKRPYVDWDLVRVMLGIE